MALINMLLGVILVTIIARGRQAYSDELNFDTIYLAGNNFYQLHRMFQAQMPNLKLVFLAEVLFSIAKISFLHSPRYDVIITHIWLSIYMVYMQTKEENLRRKAFDEQLKSRGSLKKFKELIDSHLPENVIVFDKLFTKVFFSNSIFRKTFNLTREESAIELLEEIKCGIEQPSGDTIISSDQSLLSQLKKVLPQTLQLNCYYKSGESKRLYSTNAFPFLWDCQEAVTVILSDITAQKELISLQVADTNKDKALSTVSHELRTPISIILSMIKMAEMQNVNKLLQTTLDIIKSNANLLLNIVNCVLDLKQIRAGKISLNKQQIDLKETLSSLRPMFQLQCEQKNIELKLELDRLPQTIYTDKNRFIQIIINLVANSLKFTFKGSITIGGEIDPEDSNKVWFWIKDTGIGIKDEDKDKLFKMFGKLEDSSKINTHGVGLGLTISNSLVKILNENDENSHIRVESEYGKGSKFYFYLWREFELKIPSESSFAGYDELKSYNTSIPVSVLGGVTPSRPLSVGNQRSFSPPVSSRQYNIEEEPCLVTVSKDKVLLVDDNTFNLIFPKLMLEQEGYNVITAYNGKEALAVVEKEAKDIRLILMDCQMPVMDGFEATAILKQKMKKNELPNIPIYALSANDLADDKERCTQVGMDGFIMKPLNRDEMNKILEQCRRN